MSDTFSVRVGGASGGHDRGGGGGDDKYSDGGGKSLKMMVVAVVVIIPSNGDMKRHIRERERRGHLSVPHDSLLQ